MTMYRPPENSNRVKLIKSRFETGETKNFNTKKNGTSSDLINVNPKKSGDTVDISKHNLSRQLSDPSRRNIKRTPAFRIETNSEKNNHLFQRNVLYNRSCYFDKVQQFNSASRSNCDSNRNFINRKENISDKFNGSKVEQKVTTNNIKPKLMKSKSSHDFAYICSKFESNIHDKKSNTDKIEQSRKNIYAEPVPKALRNKNSNTSIRLNNNENADTYNEIHKASTLKINNGNKDDIQDTGNVSIGLTDTLKAALNRPLPKGPAPQKPPRTFEHASISHLNDGSKNMSFLHDHHQQQEGKVTNKVHVKHDHRYMLSKLENALRNNKIRPRRQVKCEASTTSGEDSDDSVLFKSKSQVERPSIPDPSVDLNCAFNCLTGLTCKSTYGIIKEPNSSFFINYQSDEPVYAEPFNFTQDTQSITSKINFKNDANRENSLYYMSTSLLCDDEKIGSSNMDENLIQPDGSEVTRDLNNTPDKHMSTKKTLHSLHSDLDSAKSTPLEENGSIDTSAKIKQLIDTFETKRVPNITKKNNPLHVSSGGSNRIEELKISLQKTIEKCFDDDTTVDPMAQNEKQASVDTIIHKFQTYVKTMPKYQKDKLNKDNGLFYCCLIVGWDTQKPQIKFKFPSNVKIPERIEDLCYPEAASGPLDISDNAQCYSLVITNHKGERTFGYCRRVIPEGSTRCIPLAYCILSKHRAPRFYKKILIELESRHGIPDKLREELISQFYHNKFPRPGESIKINLANLDLNFSKSGVQSQPVQKLSTGNGALDDLNLTSFVHVSMTGKYGTLNDIKKTSAASVYENVIVRDTDDLVPPVVVETNGKTELILTLHHDTRYEEADLKPLHKLTPDILLKIFASLLLERKVILISCVISKLSCCVDALQSILYPFSWPHTFIPILPQCLWDVVESPTPVICGILSISVVNNHKIEHGIVVDLDEGNVISEEGDEDNILSGCMKKAWYQGLTLANTVPPEDYVHSVYLSDAYIKVFIVSLKHYKSHITGNSFEKDTFIRSAKTKGIRRFLKWFTETTMFVSFIDSVMSNPESFTLFDKKIEMYGSDGSNGIITKLIDWKKS